MSPTRSTKVTIINQLSSDLILQMQALAHGIWTEDMFPPQVIPSGSTVSFQAESDGFMTGDEGVITYSGPIGQFRFVFDNPYNGSNSYDDEVPDGYVAVRSGGGGDNADVTWLVRKLT